MPKRQVLAIAAAALTLAATGGAASASALSHGTPAPASHHAAAAATLGPTAAGPGDPPGPGCGFTKAIPFDRYKGLPDFTKKRAARGYLALLHTTQGLIVVRALTTKAPCTTFSFRFLAQRNYFTGTHCHRLTVLQIFVLQCGDPTGTGSGAPGYAFKNENLAGATYPAGTVGMANAGPDTNGSQFFFCWKASPRIPPNYTPFGVVIEGMNVLRKIAAAGDDSQNGPGDGYPRRFVEFRHIKIIFTP